MSALEVQSTEDLMVLYHELGQPDKARNAYRRFCYRLAKENGKVSGYASPSPKVLQKRSKQISRRTSQLQPLPSMAPPADVPMSVPPSSAPTTDALLPSIPPLPVRLTRFFGREQEIRQLRTMLENKHRLITLIGPGGTGKTRLAIEAAALYAPIIEGRVWFLPLADLTHAEEIPDVIARVLALPSNAEGSRLDQIVDYLKRKSGASGTSLFIFDNFEHLVSAGVSVIHNLLEGVSGLTCMVTSRQILALEGEQVVPVEPLALPNMTARYEELLTNGSIRLFLDRAQARKPTFVLTSGNRADVALLCRRLEGIPLAIELAAGRIATHSPKEILAELAQTPLDLLISRQRDRHPRHHTMRGVILWSYRLLSPPIQRSFAYLSVFHNGWSREAAVELFNSDEIVSREDAGAEDSLETLLLHSLIVADNSAGSRFRMLELLREFAAELLTPQEQSDFRQRHAAYFLRLAEEIEVSQTGPQAGDWWDRIEREQGNFRATLEWCLEERNRTEMGMRLIHQVCRFWMERGYLRLGWDYSVSNRVKN